MKRFKGTKYAVFLTFAVCAILIILAAVFAPVLCAGKSPVDAELADALLPPDSRHWFGTDQLGRDVFARVIYGARTTLSAALAVVAIIFVLGTLLGILAGYFGGIMDAVIMRFSDMMVSFPGMVLAIAVAGISGASIKNAVIAVSFVSWTKYARLARSLVAKTGQSDYLQAAVVAGSRQWYMLTHYMLPAVLPTLVVTAATDIGSMILELAGLSFLGFGAQPPAPEWGLMLNEGRPHMQTASWLMVFPGLAIFLVVLVFNFLGDSLRDVLDVRKG